MPREYWQSSFSSARHTISRSVNPELALHLKFHFQYAMCFMEFVLGQASLCHKLKAWSQEKAKIAWVSGFSWLFFFRGCWRKEGGKWKPWHSVLHFCFRLISARYAAPKILPNQNLIIFVLHLFFPSPLPFRTGWLRETPPVLLSAAYFELTRKIGKKKKTRKVLLATCIKW